METIHSGHFGHLHVEEATLVDLTHRQPELSAQTEDSSQSNQVLLTVAAAAAAAARTESAQTTALVLATAWYLWTAPAAAALVS